MWAMFQADLMQFKRIFLGKIIDRFVWVTTYIIVMTYIMPSFGLTKSFGPFLLAGLICSIGLLETYSGAAVLVADLDGDRTISYYLTLPIPSWLIFVRLIIYYAVYYGALAVFILPFGNLLLPESINLAAISWPRFGLIFLLMNILHGTIVLWAASNIKNMATLGKIWSRVLHPAWFLGCFQFSWHMLYALWPKVAYLLLLNPVVYTMEGMRSALLGADGYIPFWICCVVLTISIVLLTYNAITRFKKRLDFV
jgi:ABC-2 type transport system permease protein